ncbi:MAG TPA: DUF2807 domain-containing protein [Vicinamibacteria bacterium]|nr:DUF2807 domain-containing protein [Vicinamibacteria bacterium]
MRRALLRTGAGAAVALLCGCGHTDNITSVNPAGGIVGSGVLASESRPVSGFDAVTVDAPFHVLLTPGGGESLQVTAEDNVLPLVQSEVRGGRLFLGLVPHGNLTLTREILCRVTVAEIRDFDASGAARIEIKGVEAAGLGVRLSGAAAGSAGGAVGHLTLDLTGASRWSAVDLRSQTVAANVSGASYALVRAVESLVANVSGASTLEYAGDPAVEQTVSGTSVLRRVGP